MNYKSVDEFMKHLKSQVNAKESSRQLCVFFAQNRFGDESFNKHFLDASDDGGIDYFFHSGKNQFNIIQSKFDFHNSAKNFNQIKNEIDKILSTITNPTRERCPSTEGNDFVKNLIENSSDPKSCLDIYYLTTGTLSESVKDEVENYIKKRVSELKWSIRVVFNGFDINSIDTMIINKKYGFTPYTGRKELKIKNKKFIEYTSENLDSIVFSTELENIISWFDSRSEIKKYIQKNVRGYLGEKNKSVNKKIQESYKYDPTYFWFKHNGIIFFVDHYTLSDNEEKIILNNPQIVNGAQTINAIFGVFDERKNAEVLIRVVKLPYDRKKSYETGLKIIEALNSQTEVKPSDLRSNDEQQVKLENLVSNMNNNYRYFRKRELSHQNTI